MDGRMNPRWRRLEMVALVALLLLVLFGALHIRADGVRETVELVTLGLLLFVVSYRKSLCHVEADGRSPTRRHDTIGEINRIVSRAWERDDVDVNGGK